MQVILRRLCGFRKLRVWMNSSGAVTLKWPAVVRLELKLQVMIFSLLTDSSVSWNVKKWWQMSVTSFSRPKFCLKILVLVELPLKQLNHFQNADKSDFFLKSRAITSNVFMGTSPTFPHWFAVVMTKASVTTHTDDTAFPTRKHEKQRSIISLFQTIMPLRRRVARLFADCYSVCCPQCSSASSSLYSAQLLWCASMTPDWMLSLDFVIATVTRDALKSNMSVQNCLSNQMWFGSELQIVNISFFFCCPDV